MATAERVFINVPFDNQYRKLFHALIFAINECGFSARCALDGEDGSEVRMDKLYKLIADCPFGIHDLSRTTLDTANRLPRFNMPLELGVFLGAKRYGNTQQRKKSCLILEREQYRYQTFCSDLSGQDIRAHGNDVGRAITAVRNWLRSSRPKRTMPGSARIATRYLEFRRDYPRMCAAQHLVARNIAFLDYKTLVVGWRAENQ